MDDAQGTTRQDPPTLAWRSGGDPHTASLWLDAPGVPPAEPLDGSTTADVVVVGAGLAGLWTAYYLLEHDPALDVLLVEADAVGHGATGRAGGWCSAGSPADAAAVADRHGTEAAVALRAALRDAVVEIGGVAAAEQIDCDFAVGGLLAVARTPTELAALADAARQAVAWGDDVEVLTAAQVARRTGWPAAGGTFTPDCARLDPVALARGLADVVQARGGRLVEGTRALRVAPRALVTDQGVVRAGRVVVATGAVPRLPGTRGMPLPDPRAGLRARPRREAGRLHTVATAPLPAALLDRAGLARGCTLTTGGPAPLRVLRTAQDRLVATGPARRTRLARLWRRDPGQDLAATRRVRDALLDLVPAARLVPVTHAWGGPAPEPEPGHGLPLGLADSGVAWTGPLGPDGVAAANLVGRTLADLLAGADSALTRLPRTR